MSSKEIPPGTAQTQPVTENVPASQTLYVSNLNDKIAKNDLRRALYTLFSTHGHILDVVAQKTMKMRGQAHIVFRDKRASAQAMESLQGFNFLGREMRISYAKSRSDIISKLEGTTKVLEAVQPNKAGPIESSKPNANNAPPSESTKLSAPNGTSADGSKSPQGIKRPRDEASGDESEAMQEEDDEGSAMEVSDEEE